MVHLTVAAIAAILSFTSAQTPGTRDNHPRLTTQQCSKWGGCRTQQTSVVLDALSHSIHTKNGTACTAASNGKDCIIDGVDYAAAGVYTSGSSMTLHMYMNESGKINVPVSPRVYLLDQSGQEYSYLRLLNQEISFDADVSNLPCGMNGALYLTSMEQDGGRSSVNPAGATYGTGYCDAQCPKSSFINGAPNTANYGACCAEMDLWEANVAATQLTPHPCSVDYLYQCNGTECLNSQFGGVCDEWGCGFNPYKGDPNYFAPGGVVDSSKTFTVVTQFLTTDGTAHGTLDEIRRLYVQDGKTIASDSIPFMVGGVNETTDSINPEYCNATATTTFTPAGGFAQMSKNLADGMVLIFSIWNDQYGNMTWLDTGASGPCTAVESGPSVIVAEDPGTSVTFSNIRWGDLNSTYTGNPHGGGNGNWWGNGWGKTWHGGPKWGHGHWW